MFIYRLIATWLGLLIYPYGRLRAAYGSVGWRDRLALWSGRSEADIWIHASSVGEVKVANVLIGSLLRRSPNLKLHLSVMTTNGYKTARVGLDKLGENSEVTLSYLPLDIPFLTDRAMKIISPKLLVITETEIWPGLINSASESGCEVILVNGRMSDRSLRKYLKIPKLLSFVTTQYQFCFFKTEADKQRFVKLGLPNDRAEVAGDMKFDSPLNSATNDQIAAIRKRLGVEADNFLLVAGSTRPGTNGEKPEDELLADLYANLKPSYPKLRLVLAPRHLERCEAVIEKLNSQGLSAKLITQAEQGSAYGPETILVIGYMGGLIPLYQAADLAFVGGTLVPIGGHNLLEPVWAGTPVLFGSSLDNVTEAAEFILRANLGARIDTIEQLQKLLAEIIDGKVTYRLRTGDDPGFSATSQAVDYMMARLGWKSDA